VTVIVAAAVVPAVVITWMKKHSEQGPSGSSSNTTIPSNLTLSGGINHCPGGDPGGAQLCSFEPQADLGSIQSWSIVGTPVENCNDGNLTSQTTIGGQAGITRQWSSTATGELLLPLLQITGDGDWQDTQDWESTQSVTITIAPHTQAALALGIWTNVTSGRVLIDYDTSVNGSMQWYIDNITLYQPTNKTSYNTLIIGCNDTFPYPEAPPTVPSVPRSASIPFPEAQPILCTGILLITTLRLLGFV